MRKKCTRTIAAIAALVFAIQGAAILPPASAAGNLKASAVSSTQMSSTPEVVYVSSYGTESDRSVDFNRNWKFNLGDANGANAEKYNDSAWRQLDLPHDYSIEQEFTASGEAESGYLLGGVGWYRKYFTMDKAAEGKRVRVDFDGIYMDATIWVNGTLMGTHPYGYSPFSIDITDQLKFGAENVIAVKVNHQTPSSRWYSGSGIYRDVKLTVTDPVHVALNGTQITDDLSTKSNGSETLTIKADIENDSKAAANVTLTHTLYKQGNDTAIKTVSSTPMSIGAGLTKTITATMQPGAVELWDVYQPNLYTVRTQVKVNHEVVDTYDTEYGFRYFRFDTNKGFYLNGKPVKLKGVCMHHDQGALGAVNNRRAVERQVEILMDMGVNSIRVTHNPASQNLIDVCNEKGVIVIEEIFDGWMLPKNGNRNDFARFFEQHIGADNKLEYADPSKTWAQYSLQETLRRDRNAPSIILWSLGNEIQEGAGGGQEYVNMVPNLIEWAKAIDTSKLLTVGSNSVKNGDYFQTQVANKITEAGGVSGTNYSRGSSYDDLHRKHPDWRLVGSETASSVNSRGIYNRRTDGSRTSDKQLTSYDGSWVGWGASANDAWRDVIQRDFVAGEYVWTGFDYIGEPTHWNGTGPGAQGEWPSPKNSYFGIIDTAGFPKDSYYLDRSQWNTLDDTLHIMPAWNSEVVVNGGYGPVPVVVYSSNADKVVLTLTPADGSAASTYTQEFDTLKSNDGSGMYEYKALSNNHSKLYTEFQVPFKAGTLTAKAYKKQADGSYAAQPFKTSSIQTAGAPAALKVTADRSTINANGYDLSYLTVEVVDKDGNMVPYADNRVSIQVDGAGKLVGVDNGSAPDHDSYKGNSRKAFGGKMLAIVQAGRNAGDIKVTASAEGIDLPVTFTVKAKAVSGEGTSNMLEGFLMSKSYFVKTGTIPTLPATIEARYTAAEPKKLNVTWDTITKEQVAKAGTFTVNGVAADGAEKYNVSVSVTVLDQVGGLLNYSTTTQVNTKPNLPAQRPAVMPDGTILDVEFPVKWEDRNASDFATKGNIVNVEGTADVLGTPVLVNAAVRVLEESITIGGSVSKAAYLSTNVTNSDTLDAIKDGRTAIDDNMSGGANPSCWSNWKASQDGVNKAEITFRYDTQQRIGQVVAHFAKDQGSMRYPDANTVEIWVSDSDKEDSFQKVEAKETIGNENGRVKAYTYDFAPVTATYVRLKITNSTVATGTHMKACTAITEVELKEAKGTFVTYSDAQLATLTINGYQVPAEQLAVRPNQTGVVGTAAATAEISASAKNNAAVTMLPDYNGVAHIIVESEDHTARSYMNVVLNQPITEDPTSDARDYDRNTTTAFAESTWPGQDAHEGPASYVVDNKPDTHWHTNWQNTEAKNEAKRWVGLDLGSAKPIAGIRVLPRQHGGGNGRVTEYRVETSNDRQTWTPVPGATGRWNADDANWQLVTFAKPVTAQYVRLVGVHTSAADGNDKHMSLSELRATKPCEDLSGATVEIPASVTVDKVSADEPVTVKPFVKLGSKVLHYGFDYTISYRNNDKAGTATVVITGIDSYTGTATADFEIVVNGTTPDPEVPEKITLENELKEAAKIQLNQYENDLAKTIFTSKLRTAKRLPSFASEAARTKAANELHAARLNLTPKA